jgi:hypothetical protein
MERLKNALAVLFLLVFVIVAVITGWREGFKAEEGDGPVPGANEEWIGWKLDRWTPMAP